MYGKIKYGDLRYGEDLTNGLDNGEEYDIELMRYMPKYYHTSEIVIDIFKTVGRELGYLNYKTEDLGNQFNVKTATWGLSEFERDIGEDYRIPTDLQARREIIRSKWMSSGTVTKEMIKDAAEAFSGGEVEVLDIPSEYRFIVKFIGTTGVPENMKGFISMLEEIKPAHLGYTFKYTFTTCQMLIDANVICSDLINNNITCDDLKVYEI